MKECFFKQATQTSVMHNFVDAFTSGCTRCTLSDSDNLPIIYKGNPESDILLIGEAPGKVEQEEGIPFVGPAGQLLEKIMTAIDIDIQKDMCISNCVYCRPVDFSNSNKQNYTPKEDQLVACYPFVENLIRIVKPKVIIACGRIALQQLTKDNSTKISTLEGKWTSYTKVNERNIDQEIPMFVMVHPAAILYIKENDKQIEKKKQVWTYMKEFRDSWKGKRKC